MADQLNIRHAVVADAESLCAAEREISKTPGLLISLPHEFALESFREKIARLADAGCYLVAENQGRVAGHALLEPISSSQARLAHVFSLTIAVHPGHAGQGIGSALMTALLKWAGDHSVLEKIELRVREGNAPAQALYTRFGFVEEGRFEKRIKLAGGDYLADISMAKFFRKN